MEVRDLERPNSAEGFLKGIPLPSPHRKLHVLVTVVELEDIGTVGSDGTPLNQDSLYSNDPSSKERVALGLPLAFGSTKKSHKKGRSFSKRTGDDGSNVNPAKIRATMKTPLLKYWLQRYSLFSRFDEGIAIDEEGWYSTTPECIAPHHAKKCTQLQTPSQRLIVLDGFCGVGGNAIQFAANGHYVIAIDIDEHRLKLAQGNCGVYEVMDGVEFIHGDFFTIAKRLVPNVVFLSPPWGGPAYLHQSSITLSDENELGRHLIRALEVCLQIKERTRQESLLVMMFLPRNIELVSLGRLMDGSGLQLKEVEIMKVNGLLKGLTVISRLCNEQCKLEEQKSIESFWTPSVTSFSVRRLHDN